MHCHVMEVIRWTNEPTRASDDEAGRKKNSASWKGSKLIDTCPHPLSFFLHLPPPLFFLDCLTARSARGHRQQLASTTIPVGSRPKLQQTEGMEGAVERGGEQLSLSCIMRCLISPSSSLNMAVTDMATIFVQISYSSQHARDTISSTYTRAVVISRGNFTVESLIELYCSSLKTGSWQLFSNIYSFTFRLLRNFIEPSNRHKNFVLSNISQKTDFKKLTGMSSFVWQHQPPLWNAEKNIYKFVWV